MAQLNGQRHDNSGNSQVNAFDNQSTWQRELAATRSFVYSFSNVPVDPTIFKNKFVKINIYF